MQRKIIGGTIGLGLALALILVVPREWDKVRGQASPSLLSTPSAPLLANPSFEQGFKGWIRNKPDGPGKFSLDQIAVEGNKSIRIEVSERGRLKLRTRFPAEPEQVYRITFAYRTAENPAGPRASTSFRPYMTSASGQLLCYVGNPTLARTRGQWRRAEFFIKAHPNTATAALEFNVQNGQTIWLDDFDVRPAQPGPDDYVYAFQPLARDPVYEQVLSNRPGQYNVLPNWTHNMGARRFRERALKFGVEYRLAPQYAGAARHDLATTIFPTKKSTALAKRHDMPILGFVYDYQAVIRPARNKGLDVKRPPLTHPLVKRLMLGHMKDLYDRWGEQLWGLFYVDEPYADFNHYLSQWDAAARKRVSAQVREEYGGGQYGLPSSPKADDEPYRWIAYRRWADDQLFKLFRSIQELAEQIDPSVVLIGPNEINMAAPRDWERLAKTWDVTTGQGHASHSRVGKHAVGFVTKLMRDLSFKPTMPFVQVSAYVHASTIAFTVEQYSQVMRNGGAGFWINGVEWKDRELNHPKYSAPRRWAAMLNLAEHVRKMPQLDLPTADAAIFYSVDTYQARRAAQDMAPEAAATYTFLGPEVGSWFHFVSEYQVERDSRDLSDYEVIYVPAARYLRRNVAERLVEYVRNGGKIVCLDPRAFERTPLGEDLTDVKHHLLGVAAGDEIAPVQLAAAGAAEGLDLPRGDYPIFAKSTALKVVDQENSQVVMRFGDGSPAAVLHRLGEGATLTLAYNPARSASVDHAIWRNFFRAMQRWAGAQMELAIWRFQLPLDLPPLQLDPPAGLVCLTDNNVRMANSVVTTPRNVETGGGYRYVGIAPAEEEIVGKLIPFDQGKLTNRVAAYRSIRGRSRWATSGRAKKDYKQGHWAISWPASKEQPLVIEVELDRPRALRAVRLIVSGQVPQVTIQAAQGGASSSTQFTTVGSIDAVSPGKDVVRVGTTIDATAQVLRLVFNNTNRGGFVISEIEVWGTGE